MRWVDIACAVAAASCAAGAAIPNNTDVVLPPPPGKDASMPEALLIFVPGGKVPAGFYAPTVAAIQEAANLRLWAVVPSIPSMLCIQSCALTAVCTLRSRIAKTLATAESLGYTGPQWGPNVFVAGHSLGGVCADTLVKKYAGSDTAYGALIEMGSYVAGQNVKDYATPVFTLGTELDGGGARPGLTYKSLVSSDAAAESLGKSVGGTWQLDTKPVVILPGLDHSSFCPTFKVPGDVWPAEGSFEEGSARIGQATAAYLELRTQANQPKKIVKAARNTLAKGMAWTREVTTGFLLTLSMEKGTNSAGEEATWCEKVQEQVADLSPSDWRRVQISSAMYYDRNPNFEHSRPHASSAGNGLSVVSINITGHNGMYPFDLKDNCIVGAREIGCKLVSGARLANELKTKQLGGDTSCGQANKFALEQAEAALGQTAAGRKSLRRYHQRGRPIRFSSDTPTVGNIGPLFIEGHMRVTDCNDGPACSDVSALALGPVPLDGNIFPGVQYCKVLSPARAVDYIMTDSLKDTSGCLNM